MKISIITINYNNAEGLDHTIKSVISQSSNDFEYIVIDGGSTDESKKIIESYSNNFSFWVSEKDNGIYNAMNKGIEKANGEYCLFLNSGDYLIDDSVISTVINEINTNAGYDIYYCDLQFLNTKTNEYSAGVFPELLSLDFFSSNSIGHPGSFISKQLLLNLRYYSEAYSIISDWVLFFQAYLQGYRFKKIPLFSTIFNLDGISSSQSLVGSERERAFNNEFFNLKDDIKQLGDLRGYKGSKSHTILNKLLILFRFRTNH